MSHSGYHILSDMKEAEEARCEPASSNVNDEMTVVVTEEDVRNPVSFFWKH
jgi:hypothetical protein